MVVVIVSNYYMVVAIILLGCAFMKMRSWFISSAKRIKHLEGIGKKIVTSRSFYLNFCINIVNLQQNLQFSVTFPLHWGD